MVDLAAMATPDKITGSRLMVLRQVPSRCVQWLLAGDGADARKAHLVAGNQAICLRTASTLTYGPEHVNRVLCMIWQPQALLQDWRGGVDVAGGSLAPV